jgi:hypothetical protein
MKDPLEVLKSRLGDGADVYVGRGVVAGDYLAGLAEDIQANVCEPFELHAIVMAPGFPDFSDGEEIAGLCVASSQGRWLVYRPEDDLFYAFWGKNKEKLGARGVFGSPLYCWSA